MSPFQHHATITADLEVSASIHFDTIGEPYVATLEIGGIMIDGPLLKELAPLVLETADLSEASWSSLAA